jgi:hypothetical protein
VKPADFYLGSRQIFGFILPGLVWMASLAMVLLPWRTIESLLTQIWKFGGVIWFIVLTGALILGMVTQKLFALAFWTAHGLSGLNESLPDAKLFQTAHDRLRARYRSAEITFSRRVGQDAAADWDSRREIFIACKRILIARKSTLADYLFQLEAEVNVVGMLPAPLVAFFLCLIVRADEIKQMGYALSDSAIRWVLLVVLVALEAFALGGFYKWHASEERDCLAAFLVQEAVDDRDAPKSEAPGHTSDTPKTEATAS